MLEIVSVYGVGFDAAKRFSRGKTRAFGGRELDSSAVALDKAANADAILFDTAGRLQIDADLI